ncbi:pyroglutamyl-peptidase I [Sporosarcina aquimarina]|uniref:Pyrrolidone-carboxylate peptidase n=1 Tax=Sporosarcina aquimarina TaxID=114975 RepID=A0ABU4G2I5_9BACL|nr:pyroglutamyl-peptidase I [Sporosarcina aquimarina]MDW0109867.1 pyroglutamyl-peptidase I [Sporosarcina aquimarina]
MKKLLLTGFEPFLAYPQNPTMQIVEKLHGSVIGDYMISGKILSVDFNASGSELLRLIEEEEPNALLSLGLAGGRHKMTPERVALNVKDGEPDNNGHQPVDEVIRPGGPPAYFSTLPIREMVNRLSEEGLPAAISNSAGTYLCNNVMYEGLYWAAEHNPEMSAGFLHIPASFELAIQNGKIPGWSLEDLLRGVTICIRTLSE